MPVKINYAMKSCKLLSLHSLVELYLELSCVNAKGCFTKLTNRVLDMTPARDELTEEQ